VNVHRNPVKRIKWAGHVTYGGNDRCHRILVGKLEGREPLERGGHRWEDDIKVNI
jgi:hypothetical protein